MGKGALRGWGNGMASWGDGIPRPGSSRANFLTPGLLMLGPLMIGPLLLGIVACGPADLPPSDAAARVGEEAVPYRLFEQYLERNVGKGETALSSAALTHLFDQFLDEEVLYHLALESTWITPGDTRRQAIEAALSHAASNGVDEAAVSDYYEQHRGEFERPERVRLRQILVAEQAQAKEALAALAAGEDFAQVAERISIDPNASRGGDQGELAETDLPPAFVGPVFSLEPGEISPIVEAEYGFHIFQVVAREPPQVIPLEVAHQEILLRLRQQIADQQLGELLEKARGRYNIQVYEQNLPFEYRGTYRAEENSRR
ncbi:MAG: peptidyl-prolyl cis-trans isomerase [Deltaproteobacteria bacterium]|nr:peptidyl-prolyl cis-trans isomerase [Deltaproteobacteria bacterium]